MADWSLNRVQLKLIKIDARAVRYARDTTVCERRRHAHCADTARNQTKVARQV
jgi:hypothetical protein